MYWYRGKQASGSKIKIKIDIQWTTPNITADITDPKQKQLFICFKCKLPSSPSEEDFHIDQGPRLAWELIPFANFRAGEG